MVSNRDFNVLGNFLLEFAFFNGFGLIFIFARVAKFFAILLAQVASFDDFRRFFRRRML